MPMTKVESGMVESLDASKLTGAMPALDGSALTGISVAQELLALKTNIALNFFLDAVNHARGVQNLSDGFVDQFEDQTGVDDLNSTEASYNSTGDYYSSSEIESSDVSFASGGSGCSFGRVTQASKGGGSPIGQTIVAGATGNMTRISFKINKTGSPTDNLTVKLYTVSGGFPNTLLATSDAIAGTTLSGSFVDTEFTFSSPYSITNGTSYALTITRSGADSDTNYYSLAAKFSHESAPHYDSGQLIEDIGAGWANTTSADNDLYITTYVGSGTNNLTLISESSTALISPNTAQVTLFKEDVDALTLNTDLIAWASRSKQTITATNATNVLNATAHGLSDNDRVMVTSSGQDLPSGLDSETVYYVVTSTTSTFQVALTSGGSAVTFSDDGTGTHSVLAVTAATLVNQSTIAPYNTVNASVDISSQPSGTNMNLVVQTKNNKDVKIHGQSLQWS